MFTVQSNTKFSPAIQCSREMFYNEIKKISNNWKIDSRRSILEAVANHDAVAINQWLKNEDYQKFLAKKQRLKKAEAREAFFKKNDEERLTAFAQELKVSLTAFIFSCYEFDETASPKGRMFRHRRLPDCHLNGLVMLDIDHLENPLEVWEQLKSNQKLMELVKLVHITSSRKGIRIVFAGDPAIGNLADNQIVFAKCLGYQADASCIDATRNSFAPKEEDVLFIDDSLFDYYNEEFDKMYTPMYRAKKTQPLYHQFPTDKEKPTKAAVATESSASEEPTTEVSEMMWRGYNLQKIIDHRYGDKLPCKADSNRHTESLKLATDLLLMLDGDKATVQRMVEGQSWVKEIIEERDEDVAQTVASAAECVAQKEKKYASSLPSKVMLDAVQAFCGKTYQEIIHGSADDAAKSKEEILLAQLEEWGKQIEALWDDFPLLKDVCAGLKRSQYPAALFVAGGILMTLMTRCWYRFYHKPQRERRLNAALYVIGNPASGKSMADDIYKVLALPMNEADKAGKQALNRYKEEQKKKSANKEGKEKPKGLIRIHPARTANGQFINDMINAKEDVNGKEMQLHMFTFDTELDNSTNLQSGGSWINKESMELKAFHNEEDGQMYMNVDSPVDNFTVTWNYIYTGTPNALKRKVNDKNFGSGLSTRLAVLPMPDTNFEMIEYEDEESIDWERFERMKDWAYKLDKRAGQLPVKPLVRKLYEWTKLQMEECAEDNNKALEMILKRVAYHGLNYAVPFIDARHYNSLHQEGKYMTGEYEVDEIDWKLCELITNIQYATQKYNFLAMGEKYFDNLNRDIQTAGKYHHSKSLDGFNRLPDEFTREDVARCFGYNNAKSVDTKIRRLKMKNWAEEIEGSNGNKFRKSTVLLV